MTGRAMTAAILGLLVASAAGRAADIHECDVQAAHPSDPGRVSPGRGSGEVVTHRAIPACRQAIDDYPDVARFYYQLGRALVYWADANNGDTAEGVDHIQRAADMGYAQALFVLGLMHRRAGDICASEPVTRKAADQGLKSARITYVDAVLAGDYGACGVSATLEEMSAYLEGAASQVSGYYENMLLANLERQLRMLEPPEQER